MRETEQCILFLKQDCETCVLIKPVVQELLAQGILMDIYVEDVPAFYKEFAPIDGTSLKASFQYQIETTPTLLKIDEQGQETRITGWDKKAWQELFQDKAIGVSLPTFRPGCGSKSREPGVHERLVVQYGDAGITARKIELDQWDDEMEACFERGWTDGLPVVPPTDERIIRMLQGSSRDPKEIIGKVPPDLAPITIEKAAINAVMAGCKPSYFPVVLAALEAALEPIFTMHGLLCTTCFSSPIIIVNGPIAKAIGMNWGMNVLGQGNRANATIGRALQLIIRNVGGGIPGQLDRATFGGPGKYTFCFAEDETDPTWEPLSVARNFKKGENTVTLFQGDGVQGFIDQRSNTPEQITNSLASALLAVGHPKLAEFTNALLILSPEHYAIYRDAGWGRKEITEALHAAMVRPGSELIYGAQGIGEGIHPSRMNQRVNKFWPEGLLIVRAGGQAGLYSAICAGWTGGRFRHESKPITKKIAL